MVDVKVSLSFLVIVGSLASGVPLVAHHSFAAEFDAKQAIRITGALTEIEWTNPHSYFHLSVKNDNATVEQWICEHQADAALPEHHGRRAPESDDRGVGTPPPATRGGQLDTNGDNHGPLRIVSRLIEKWCARGDSNPRPLAPEARRRRRNT